MKGKSNCSDALTVLEIKRFYLVLYIVCKLPQSVVEPVVLCLI